MDELKKSALVSIIFFSWFKFPLKLKELRRYLWGQELSEEELKKLLKLLPGIRWENDLVWYGEVKGDRTNQEQLARRFWQKVRRWRWLFANVPFLREVYVTNTLAYDNVRQGSDIDLLLVGRSGRLWTCRAFLLLFMSWLRLRVTGVNRHAKFSPEFWLGDTVLELRPFALERDYYLSFWLADVVQVWPGGEPKALWRANPWLKDDLPIAWRSPRRISWPVGRASYGCQWVERLLGGSWGNALEKKFKEVQQKIITRNLKRLGVNPSVVTEDNVIKLHFNDRRAEVKEAIEKGLSELLAEN